MLRIRNLVILCSCCFIWHDDILSFLSLRVRVGVEFLSFLFLSSISFFLIPCFSFAPPAPGSLPYCAMSKHGSRAGQCRAERMMGMHSISQTAGRCAAPGLGSAVSPDPKRREARRGAAGRGWLVRWGLRPGIDYKLIAPVGTSHATHSSWKNIFGLL